LTACRSGRNMLQAVFSRLPCRPAFDAPDLAALLQGGVGKNTTMARAFRRGRRLRRRDKNV